MSMVASKNIQVLVIVIHMHLNYNEDNQSILVNYFPFTHKFLLIIIHYVYNEDIIINNDSQLHIIPLGFK